MYYNLTEEQKVFFHVSYSMLEEGYSVDEIVEFWCMDDQEEKVMEIFESVTLSEEIDFGSGDLKEVAALYMVEQRGINFNWLNRLFRGQKIRAPKVPTPTQTAGGRPITSGAGGGGTTSGGTRITQGGSGSGKNILDRIPPGVKDKIKKAAPIAGGAGLITILGKTLMDKGVIPAPVDVEPKKDDKTPGATPEAPEQPSSETDAQAEAEAKAKAEAEAKAKAEAKAEAEAKPKSSYGWWMLQNQPRDLYKSSHGFRVTRDAYRNIRANPVPKMYKDHYDLIADYLISEGHASTIEEAEYVMQQLDNDFIQSIIEEYPKKPIGYSNPSIDGNPIPNPPGHPQAGKPMSFNKAETEGYREAMQAHRKKYPNSYKKK